MIAYLIARVLGDNRDLQDPVNRKKLGYLGGLLGIILNFLLFSLKLLAGIKVASIAIMADAFNNLSDAGSSLITIIGFKLANIPADREHPYGHGRIEYISGLIVAFMVMLVGIEFARSSLGRILRPQPLVFQRPALYILVLSMGLKVWLSIFNARLGKLIESSSLKAAAADALGDVLTSGVVVLSLLLSSFSQLAIDGYMGLLVSLIIIYAGFNLVKETISPLIGEAADEELIEAIREGVLSYKYISGIHALVVHDYGPGRIMASLHAEFPANINVLDIHEVIDQAEREIGNKLNIDLVIHMDPVSVDGGQISEAREELEEILLAIEGIKSIHDLRLVGQKDRKNMIFDLIIDGDFWQDYSDRQVEEKILKLLKEFRPSYRFTIKVDREYI